MTENAREAKWHRFFEKLRSFKAEHGHCVVPRSFFGDPALSLWVNRQRQQYTNYKDGKKPFLSPERFRLLESLSFEWDANDANWKRRFEQLRHYKYEHGDCDVPRPYAPNPALYWWVFTQRKQYRLLKEGKPSSLTEAKKAELDSLDFIWSEREQHRDDLWNMRILELEKFKEINGHCSVPSFSKENKKLGRWVKLQREQYRHFKKGKKTSMTTERITTLTNMGFVFEPTRGKHV